jgi:GH25 family lysozyme M1 (1,4-beta-N-acetylmuramidase)
MLPPSHDKEATPMNCPDAKIVFRHRRFANCKRFSLAAFLFLFAAFGISKTLAQRPLGIDVSSYQGSGIVWTSVKNSGVSFAWAKATEGVSVTDPDFTINAANAKAAGVLIGAYDFAHPEDNTPSAEATHFWSVAGGYIRNDGLSIQPVLDYETFTAPNNIPVGASSYADWANQWCSNIVSKAAAAGLAVKPIIYTSTCDAGYLNSVDAQWLPWVANPSGLSAQTGSPWSDTTCNSSSDEIWGSGAWTVWQYSWTGTVPGINDPGAMDLDVFNGTSNQMVATLVIGTNSLPSVALVPQLDLVVDAGGSASFNGSAFGTAPLNYQWLFNGTPIPGATTNFYNVANAQTNDAGNYALVVNNYSGSTTSSVVSLTVFPVQTTIFSDNFDANTAANWIVNKSSADNSVAFNFDYSTLGIPSAPHSTNGTTRGVQMKANLSLGVVAALSISPTNQSFSGDYRLHFDAWINVNGPLPGGIGSTEFLTGGIGTAGNRTEWTGSGSTADGFYFSADGDGGVSATSTTTGDYSGYRGTVWQNAASGIYAAGSLDNTSSYYSTAFPTNQSAPALQQANYPQQSGALASGTFGLAWHDVIVSRRGSNVNWAVDGILFASITNASFTASNVFVGFWDPFASLSSNNAVNFGLVDNVRVEVPAVAPFLTLQTGAAYGIFGSGLTGATYLLQTSTNLTDWTTVTSLTATNGSFEYDFVPPAGDAQRFFRALSGP